MLPEIINKFECEGFALGFMSLDSRVWIREDCLSFPSLSIPSHLTSLFSSFVVFLRLCPAPCSHRPTQTNTHLPPPWVILPSPPKVERRCAEEWCCFSGQPMSISQIHSLSLPQRVAQPDTQVRLMVTQPHHLLSGQKPRMGPVSCIAAPWPALCTN